MFSCFAAAGFGFAVALMAGAAYWYRFTPTAAPKPWNTKAIQASYVATTMTEQTKGSRLQAKFEFDVCNTTQSDYTLQTESSDALVVMQKVRSEATLVDGIGLTWTLDHGSGIGQYHAAGIPGLPRELFLVGPIFIPAGATVRVDFWSEYDTLDIGAVIGKNEEIQLSDPIQQRKILNHTLEGTDSFVLLDKANHYRIELPLPEAMKN